METAVPALGCVGRKRDREFETGDGRSDSLCSGEGEGIREGSKPGKRSCNGWTSAEGSLSEFLLSEDDDDIINLAGESIVDGVAVNEELVSGVMKTLEEEIARPLETTSGNDIQSTSSSAAADIQYLSAASDDELGLPPSPPILPVYQKPAGDDCSLFDQNFPTGTVGGTGPDRDDEHEEFLQIREAADSFYGFDENEYGSLLAFADPADWFQRTPELLDIYNFC